MYFDFCVLLNADLTTPLSVLLKPFQACLLVCADHVLVPRGGHQEDGWCWPLLLITLSSFLLSTAN